MKGLVITANTQADLKLLAELAKKLGLGHSAISDTELEDMGLSKLMKQVDRTKKVSRSEIMRKLAN